MKVNGTLIRTKRAELGHGVNRFAVLVGISSAALSRIENGLRNPRPETLKKITDGLGCQIADIASPCQHAPGGASEPEGTNDDAAGVAPPAASVEQSESSFKPRTDRS